ncbi:MAG: orotate phosphoribosyltransferase [Candidatus Diapherotrites archaeon]|nr:orotate phosphoribosyltransferase [Candidatus Diapherotrites archaeon]
MDSFDKVQKEIWKTEREFFMKQIALLLVKNNAISFGDFTWTSGLNRPYYVDLRMVLSDPVTLDWIANAMARLIINDVGVDRIDRIAGVPTAGVPFATLVSQKLGLPMVYSRRKKKEYGNEKQIEGKMVEGDRILLIDDLISTGSSMLGVTSIIRDSGGVVNDAVVLLDHELGGSNSLRADHVEPHVLFRISEAFKWLRSIDLVTQEQFDLLMKYVSTQESIV